jgi:hypothetical protein
MAVLLEEVIFTATANMQDFNASIDQGVAYANQRLGSIKSTVKINVDTADLDAAMARGFNQTFNVVADRVAFKASIDDLTAQFRAMKSEMETPIKIDLGEGTGGIASGSTDKKPDEAIAQAKMRQQVSSFKQSLSDAMRDAADEMENMTKVNTVTPTFNFENVHEFNTLMDIKIAHWRQLKRVVEDPITPEIEGKGVFTDPAKLKQELSDIQTLRKELETPTVVAVDRTQILQAIQDMNQLRAEAAKPILVDVKTSSAAKSETQKVEKEKKEKKEKDLVNVKIKDPGEQRESDQQQFIKGSESGAKEAKVEKSGFLRDVGRGIARGIANDLTGAILGGIGLVLVLPLDFVRAAVAKLLVRIIKETFETAVESKPIASALKKTGIQKDDVYEFDENLAKTVSNGLRAGVKKGITDGISDGFSNPIIVLKAAIFQSLSTLASRGINAGFQSSGLTAATAKVGAYFGEKATDIGKGVGGAVKTGADIVGTGIRQFSGKVGIDTIETFENKKITNLEKVGAITKSIAATAKKEFWEAGEKISESIGDIDGAAIVKPLIAPIVNYVDKTLTKNRLESIEKDSLPLVLQRAAEISAKNAGGNSGTSVVEQRDRRGKIVKGTMNAETLVVTTGGFANMGGRSGHRLIPMIEAKADNKTKVISVQNRDNDLNRGFVDSEQGLAKKLHSWSETIEALPIPGAKTVAGKIQGARDIFDSATVSQAVALAKPNLRGHSKDAIEMSAQALAAIEKNPTIKIRFVVESAGGNTAEEATAILEMLGHGDNVSYVGMGTPDFIGGLGSKGSKILSPNEPAGKAVSGLRAIGLASESQEQSLAGFYNHAFHENDSYHLNDAAEYTNALRGEPEEYSESRIAQSKAMLGFYDVHQASKSDPKQNEAFAKELMSELQQVRRRLIVAEDSQKENLQELATKTEAAYLKVSPESDQIRGQRAIVEDASAQLRKLKRTPGLASASEGLTSSRQLAQDLKKLQSTAKADPENRPGTEVENKYKNLESDLSTVIKELAELSKPVKREEPIKDTKPSAKKKIVDKKEGVYTPPFELAADEWGEGSNPFIQPPARNPIEPVPFFDSSHMSDEVTASEHKLRVFQIQYLQELTARAAGLAIDLQRLAISPVPITTNIPAQQQVDPEALAAIEVQRIRKPIVQKPVAENIPAVLARPKPGSRAEVASIADKAAEYQSDVSTRFQSFRSAIEPIESAKGAKAINSRGVDEIAQLYVDLKQSSLRAIKALQNESERLTQIIDSSDDDQVVAEATAARLKVRDVKGQITKYVSSGLLKGSNKPEDLLAAEKQSYAGKRIEKASVRLQSENPGLANQLKEQIAFKEKESARSLVYDPVPGLANDIVQPVQTEASKKILSDTAQRLKNRKLGRRDADLNDEGFGQLDVISFGVTAVLRDLGGAITGAYKKVATARIRAQDAKKNAEQFPSAKYPYAPAVQLPRQAPLPEGQDPLYNEEWGKYYDDQIAGKKANQPPFRGHPGKMDFQAAGLAPDDRKQQMVEDHHNGFLDRLNDEAIGHKAPKSSFFGFFGQKTDTQDKTTPQRPKVESLVSDFPEQLQEQQVNAFHSAIQKKAGVVLNAKQRLKDASTGNKGGTEGGYLSLVGLAEAANKKIGDLMNSVENNVAAASRFLKRRLGFSNPVAVQISTPASSIHPEKPLTLPLSVRDTAKQSLLKDFEGMEKDNSYNEVWGGYYDDQIAGKAAAPPPASKEAYERMDYIPGALEGKDLIQNRIRGFKNVVDDKIAAIPEGPDKAEKAKKTKAVLTKAFLRKMKEEHDDIHNDDDYDSFEQEQAKENLALALSSTLKPVAVKPPLPRKIPKPKLRKINKYDEDPHYKPVKDEEGAGSYAKAALENLNPINLIKNIINGWKLLIGAVFSVASVLIGKAVDFARNVAGKRKDAADQKAAPLSDKNAEIATVGTDESKLETPLTHSPRKGRLGSFRSTPADSDGGFLNFGKGDQNITLGLGTLVHDIKRDVGGFAGKLKLKVSEISKQFTGSSLPGVGEDPAKVVAKTFDKTKSISPKNLVEQVAGSFNKATQSEVAKRVVKFAANASKESNSILDFLFPDIPPTPKPPAPKGLKAFAQAFRGEYKNPEPDAPPETKGQYIGRRFGAGINKLSSNVFPEVSIDPDGDQKPHQKVINFGRRLFGGAQNVSTTSNEVLRGQGVPVDDAFARIKEAIHSVASSFNSQGDRLKQQSDELGLPTQKIIDAGRTTGEVAAKLVPGLFDGLIHVLDTPGRTIRNAPSNIAKTAGAVAGVGVSAATVVTNVGIDIGKGLFGRGGGAAAALAKDFLESVPQLEKPLEIIKEMGAQVGSLVSKLGGLNQILSSTFARGLILTGIGAAFLYLNKFGEAAALASTQFDRIALKANAATQGQGAALIARSKQTAQSEGLDVNLVRDTNTAYQSATIGTSESGRSAQLVADALRSSARLQGLNKDESNAATKSLIDSIGGDGGSPAEVAAKLTQGGFADGKLSVARAIGTDVAGVNKVADYRGFDTVDVLKLAQNKQSESAISGATANSQEASATRLTNSKQAALEGLGEKLKPPAVAIELIAKALESATVAFEIFATVVAAAVLVTLTQAAFLFVKLTIAVVDFGAATLTAGNNWAFMGLALRAGAEGIVKVGFAVARALAPIVLMTIAIEAAGRAWDVAFGKSAIADSAESAVKALEAASLAARGIKPTAEGIKTDAEVKEKALSPDIQTKAADFLIDSINKTGSVIPTGLQIFGPAGSAAGTALNFSKSALPEGKLRTTAEGNEVKAKNDYYDKVLPSAEGILKLNKDKLSDPKLEQELATLRDSIAINKQAQQLTTNTPEDQVKRKQLIEEGSTLQAKFLEKNKPLADQDAATATIIKDLQTTYNSRVLPQADTEIKAMIAELEKTRDKFKGLASAASEISIAFNKTIAALSRQDRVLDQSKARIGIASSNDRIAATIARREEEDDYSTPGRTAAAGIANTQREIAAAEIDITERKRLVAKLKATIGPEFEKLDPIADKEKFNQVKNFDAIAKAKAAESNKLFKTGDDDDYEKALQLKNDALRAEQQAAAIRASKPNLAVDPAKLKEVQAQEDKILQITQEYADKRASVEEARLAKEIQDEKEAVQEIEYYYQQALNRNRAATLSIQTQLVPIVPSQTKVEFGEKEARGNVNIAENTLKIEQANKAAFQKLVDDGDIGLNKREVDDKILEADTKIAEARKALLEAEKSSILAITASTVRQLEQAEARVSAINARIERDAAVAASKASRAALSPVNLKQSFLAIDVSDTVTKLQTLKNEAASVEANREQLANRKRNNETNLSADNRQDLTAVFGNAPARANVEQLGNVKDQLEAIKDQSPQQAAALGYVKVRLEIDKEEVALEAKKTGLATSVNQAQKDVQTKMKEIYQSQVGLAKSIIDDSTQLKDELRRTTREITQGNSTNRLKQALLGITGYMSEFADSIINLIDVASGIGNDASERAIADLRSRGKYNPQLDQLKESSARVVAEGALTFGATSVIGNADDIGGGGQRTLINRFTGDGKLQAEGSTPEFTGRSPFSPPEGVYTPADLGGAGTGFAQKVSTGYQIDPTSAQAEKTIKDRTGITEPVRTSGADGNAIITTVKGELANYFGVQSKVTGSKDQADQVKFTAALLSADANAIKIKRDLGETVRSTESTSISQSFGDRDLKRQSRRTNYSDQVEATNDESIKSFLAEQKQTDDEIRQLELMLARSKDAPEALKKALDENTGIVGANKAEIQGRIDSFGNDTAANEKALLGAVDARKARRETLAANYQTAGQFKLSEQRREQVEKVEQFGNNAQTSYLREKAGVEGTDKYTAATLIGQAALIDQTANYKKELAALNRDLEASNQLNTAFGQSVVANFTKVNELKLDKIRNEVNLMTGQISSALTGHFESAILGVGDFFSKGFERLVSPERFRNVAGGIRSLGDSFVDVLKSLGQGILGTLAKISAEAAAASISKWATGGLTGLMNGILGIKSTPATEQTPVLPPAEVAPANLVIPTQLSKTPTAILDIHKTEAAASVLRQTDAPALRQTDAPVLRQTDVSVLPQPAPIPAIFAQAANKTPVTISDQIARQQEEGLPNFRPVEPVNSSPAPVVITPPAPIVNVAPAPVIIAPPERVSAEPGSKYSSDPNSDVRSWVVPPPADAFTPPAPVRVQGHDRRSPLVEMDFSGQVPNPGTYTPPESVLAAPGSKYSADPATNVKGWVVPPPEELIQAGSVIGDGIVQKLKADDGSGGILKPLPTGQELGGSIGAGQSFIIESGAKSSKDDSKIYDSGKPVEVNIVAGGESIGKELAATVANAGNNLAQAAAKGGNVGESALKQGANFASSYVAKGVNNLLLDGAKAIFGFSDGGVAEDDKKVQIFATGGTAGGINGYDFKQVNQALNDEGEGAMLAVVHRGETMVSRKTGDAQILNSLIQDGTWAERKANKAAVYAVGGVAGGSSGLSPGASRNNRNSGPVYNDNSMVVNVNGISNDGRDQLGYSQDQIELRQQRAIARNNQGRS